VEWSPSSPSGCTKGPTWIEQPGMGSTMDQGWAVRKGRRGGLHEERRDGLHEGRSGSLYL